MAGCRKNSAAWSSKKQSEPTVGRRARKPVLSLQGAGVYCLSACRPGSPVGQRLVLDRSSAVHCLGEEDGR